MAGSDDGGSAINEVRLVGRVSATPEARTLPSGDELLTFRLVVDRPPGSGRAGDRDRRQASVDTFDIACWSGMSRRRGRSLQADDVVEVSGALRRRFWRVPGGGATSRCEIEAGSITRLRRAARAS